MRKITFIQAKEIKDSRDNPTIEVEVVSANVSEFLPVSQVEIGKDVTWKKTISVNDSLDEWWYEWEEGRQKVLENWVEKGVGSYKDALKDHKEGADDESSGEHRPAVTCYTMPAGFQSGNNPRIFTEDNGFIEADTENDIEQDGEQHGDPNNDQGKQRI